MVTNQCACNEDRLKREDVLRSAKKTKMEANVSWRCLKKTEYSYTCSVRNYSSLNSSKIRLCVLSKTCLF